MSFSRDSHTRRKRKQSVTNKAFDSYFTAVLFCVILVGIYLDSIGLKAGDRLRIFDMTGEKANGYASLANEPTISVIVLLGLGMICFWIISLNNGELPPVVYVLCSTMLILTIIFAGIYLTHTGFFHDGNKLIVAFLQISFLSLILLYAARLKDSLDDFRDVQQAKEGQYKNKVLLAINRTLLNYQKMPRVWAITSFPLLILIQLALVLFGQRPDSLIRVFLDTSSFNYSAIKAPEPEIVNGDGHYLCTVSARGHRKFVKPVRAGVRGGKRITVNRQLLIANAFENILEQYTPTCHKLIRGIYDKYGYPLSRHINTKLSADIMYLIMKPLEWVFLFVLYTIDKKPENRIHVQYSELRVSDGSDPSVAIRKVALFDTSAGGSGRR